MKKLNSIVVGFVLTELKVFLYLKMKHLIKFFTKKFLGNRQIDKKTKRNYLTV